MRYAIQGMMLAAAVGVMAFMTNAEAEDKKGEVTKTSQLERVTPATRVEFAKTYKLSYPSIGTLGARIEEARSAADPVALASLARELAVAEKVSGNKATLTGEAVADEVVTLAKLRNSSQELAVVGLLLDSESRRTELDKLAKAAKVQEDAAASAAKTGERSRGLQGDLTVTNLHEVPMRVYVNGVYRGTVSPNSTDYFYVNHPPGTTSVFEVRYPDGGSRARWVMQGNGSSFRWNIDPKIP